MLFLTATNIIIEILSGIEVDLFVPSFPEIQSIFGLSPFMVELMLCLNFFAYTVSTFVVGKLGDKYGVRLVIIWGMVGFIIGSMLCACAESYSFVLLGRVVQGIGIAGPSALAYVVIANHYSVSEQQKLMGWLNGIITLAMAMAPVIGSYVNLFFGWRGNFILLFIFGVIALIMSITTIPRSEKLASSGIKSTGYMPILRSNVAMWYIIAICFLTIPYWIFIGISPILYMQGFGVPLEHFGYYQGTLALVFAFFSFSSSVLIRVFGSKICFYSSLIICIVAIVLILLVSISGTKNPGIVTLSCGLLAAGVIFPANILWPCVLETVQGAKSRISAIMLAVKLLVTSVALQLVSYFYDGTFFNVGMIIVLGSTIALVAIGVLLRRRYFVL